MVLPKKLTHHKNDLSLKSYLWFLKGLNTTYFCFWLIKNVISQLKLMFLYINILKKTKNDFHFANAILLYGLVYICFVKKTSNPYIYESWNWQLDVYIQAQSLNTFVTSMIKKDVMNILHWIFWCLTLPV